VATTTEWSGSNVPTLHMQILKNAEHTRSEIQAMAAHSQPKESELIRCYP